MIDACAIFGSSSVAPASSPDSTIPTSATSPDVTVTQFDALLKPSSDPQVSVIVTTPPASQLYTVTELRSTYQDLVQFDVPSSNWNVPAWDDPLWTLLDTATEVVPAQLLPMLTLEVPEIAKDASSSGPLWALVETTHSIPTGFLTSRKTLPPKAAVPHAQTPPFPPPPPVAGVKRKQNFTPTDTTKRARMDMMPTTPESTFVSYTPTCQHSPTLWPVSNGPSSRTTEFQEPQFGQAEPLFLNSTTHDTTRYRRSMAPPPHYPLATASVGRSFLPPASSLLLAPPRSHKRKADYEASTSNKRVRSAIEDDPSVGPSGRPVVLDEVERQVSLRLVKPNKVATSNVSAIKTTRTVGRPIKLPVSPTRLNVGDLTRLASLRIPIGANDVTRKRPSSANVPRPSSRFTYPPSPTLSVDRGGMPGSASIPSRS